MKIFEDFFDAGGGGEFLGRWSHVLFGITWIGLLYFFNLIQVPIFAQMSAESRSEALRKLTFRALWWFRFAALLTFLTGVWMLGIQKLLGPDFDNFWKTGAGTSIGWGVVLATTMFLNVWGVIWRNQKVNIASAEAVAGGGQADPAAAGAAKAAARASRVNVFFSIPMLFFMVFTSHYSYRFDSVGTGRYALAWLVLLIPWAVMELSALGRLGGLDNAINVAVFDDHKKTMIAGFVYLAVLYFIGWELIIGA